MTREVQGLLTQFSKKSVVQDNSRVVQTAWTGLADAARFQVRFGELVLLDADRSDWAPASSAECLFSNGGLLAQK